MYAEICLSIRHLRNNKKKVGKKKNENLDYSAPPPSPIRLRLAVKQATPANCTHHGIEIFSFLGSAHFTLSNNNNNTLLQQILFH